MKLIKSVVKELNEKSKKITMKGAVVMGRVELNAAEAVLGFAAVVGGKYIADKAIQFIEENNLCHPRDNWSEHVCGEIESDDVDEKE